MDKKSLGMSESVTALLSYFFGWASGLVVFLLERDNDFVRYHAVQSMVVFGGITVLNILFSFFPMLYVMLFPVLNLLGLVLWILLMIKAAQHQRYTLPVVSEITEDLLIKFGR